MSGQFVISLDFELLWGMRDRADRRTYGENILGARVAIPRIMELFAKSDISATWAIVGFLFCKNRDELMDVSPTVDQRPRYHNPKLSNYNYFTELGWNETESPHYFAASIIEQIANTPKQEIGTHTFSHV